MKKMLERKMAELPENKREKVMAALEKDPAFFTTIAEEIQAEIKSGTSEMKTAIGVVRRHQEKLKGLITG